MLGMRVTYTFYVPGTLAASVFPCWVLDAPMTLVAISAVTSNDSDATLKFGTTDDDDAYLKSTTIGDSYVPVEFTASDFVGGQPVHIPAGTILKATLDFNGASGTAAQNLTIVVTMLEG